MESSCESLASWGKRNMKNTTKNRGGVYAAAGGAAAGDPVPFCAADGVSLPSSTSPIMAERLSWSEESDDDASKPASGSSSGVASVVGPPSTSIASSTSSSSWPSPSIVFWSSRLEEEDGYSLVTHTAGFSWVQLQVCQLRTLQSSVSRGSMGRGEVRTGRRRERWRYSSNARSSEARKQARDEMKESWLCIFCGGGGGVGGRSDASAPGSGVSSLISFFGGEGECEVNDAVSGVRGGVAESRARGCDAGDDDEREESYPTRKTEGWG